MRFTFSNWLLELPIRNFISLKAGMKAGMKAGFFTTIAFVTIFLGCSNSIKMVQQDDMPPVKAVITAGINTRAFGDQWEAGDRIGISAGEFINIEYQSMNNDGIFTAVDPGSEISFETDETIQFSAYYPFGGINGNPNPTIVIMTTSQNTQKKFDYLFGTASANRKNPVVDVPFLHSMSKLVLRIKPSTSVSISQINKGSYYLTGINNMGVFNTANGVAEPTGQNTMKRMISAPNISTDSQSIMYSMILIPQTITSLTFTASLGFDEYAAVIPLTRMLPAKSYTYNITIQKTGTTVVKVNISDWEDDTEGSGDITTNMF